MASIAGTSMSMTSVSSSFKHRLAPFARISNPNSVSLLIKEKAFPSITLRLRESRFQVNCAAKSDTVDKECEIVKKQLALPVGSVFTAGFKFAALRADSLDTVEIVMGLEEEFCISVEEEKAQSITNVYEIAYLINKLFW